MFLGMIPFVKNNDDLSARERYLLMYFIHCEQINLNPDYPRIIKETGPSRASVTEYLANLRDKDYIWVRKNGHFNVYLVNHHKIRSSAAS
jgi:hypothetical protein